MLLLHNMHRKNIVIGTMPGIGIEVADIETSPAVMDVVTGLYPRYITPGPELGIVSISGGARGMSGWLALRDRSSGGSR